MRETRQYGARVRRYTDRMANVLYDAYLRMDAQREQEGKHRPTADEVNILSWPQAWPDARCGFEEPLEDAFPTEQTNVVKDEILGTVYIYHAGRFVRTIRSPGLAFWTAVNRQDLPGATDDAAWETIHPPLTGS